MQNTRRIGWQLTLWAWAILSDLNLARMSKRFALLLRSSSWLFGSNKLFVSRMAVTFSHLAFTHNTVVHGRCNLPWSERRFLLITLQWRHNGGDGVSIQQPHQCLLNRSCRGRSTKTPKLHVTGFCVGNLPMTGEFPAQMASNADNVFIWWRHHEV